MDAIIYAAGRSTRMGPAYKNLPKILLEVGEHSLLEWHVRHLAPLGLERVYVVTGHLREQVAAHLDRLTGRYDLELIEIFNPDYSEGSVLSVHSSLPVICKTQKAILLMDGDVLYDPEIVHRLMVSPHRTALLIDCQYRTEDDDPVLVPVRQGRPFEFIKKWRGDADRVGESVGFFKIDAAEIPVLMEETIRRSLGVGRTDSYDEVIRALVKAGRFGYEDITELLWTEIDFPYDLAFAREQVWPALTRLLRTKS